MFAEELSMRHCMNVMMNRYQLSVRIYSYNVGIVLENHYVSFINSYFNTIVESQYNMHCI